MDLRELCFHLQNRRDMYLPDRRYSTAVAFIEGFNMAFDGEPLRGFQGWLSSRIRGGDSSVHWSYILAATRVPGISDKGQRLDQIPSDCDEPLIDALLRLIDDYIKSS